MNLKKLVIFLFLFFSIVANGTEPVKIAFVDTGNTGRSITAELMSKDYIKKNKLYIAVISRGLDVDPFDVKMEENATKLWKERGKKTDDHRANMLTYNDVKHADIILTLTEKHQKKIIEQYPNFKSKVFTISEYATGRYEEVSDAWGKPLDFYKNMFKQVESYIPKILTKASKIKKD